MRERQEDLVYNRSSRRPDTRWVPPVFFAASIVWMELLLRLVQHGSEFFGMGLLHCILAGGAYGLFIYLLSEVIPNRTAARIVCGVLLGLSGVIFIAQQCCRTYFGLYYQIGYMLTMADDVAGSFLSDALMTVVKNWWFIILTLIPLGLFIWLRRGLVPARYIRTNYTGGRRMASGARRPDTGRGVRIFFVVSLMIFCQVLSMLIGRVGGDSIYYTTEYTANVAVPKFGLVNTLRLEGEYAIFGQPSELDSSATLDPDDIPDWSGEGSGLSGDAQTQDPEGGTTDVPPEVQEPIVYEYNVMDIDFAGRLELDTSDTIRSMDQYFASLTPTQQNEYTGMFEGKNLIVITAEAFSPYVIDEERTPTLYMLANNGFVFNNYYQPDWSQSTTGGEFAVMTGLIPNWIDGKLAFTKTIGNEMPFALGHQFKEEGYASLAYHNNSYTYYRRNETHPTLGYDFYGVGNGLELATDGLWPNSDVELMQATVPEYIAAYKETGQNFNVYYMTISGHCNYNWGGNDMARKHREMFESMDASDPVRAYLACNQELEYAMEYLVETLEAEGVLDDTVIVLTSDHYPYGLTQNQDQDYYVELSGVEDKEGDTSRYKNTLVIWCGDMEEPIVVDTPCSSIDIVPTLSNLFGLEYDSRLLSGRDILATNYDPLVPSNQMPIAIFLDNGRGSSWITEAGTYEASTGTFTPNPGFEVSEDYVSQVKKIVQNKYLYAKYIVSQNYYEVLFGS